MKDSTKKHALDRRRFMDAVGTSAVAAAGAAVTPRPARAAVSKDRPRYGMLIDLRRCTGCRARSIACKAEFEVPLGAGPDSLRRRPGPLLGATRPVSRQTRRERRQERMPDLGRLSSLNRSEAQNDMYGR